MEGCQKCSFRSLPNVAALVLPVSPGALRGTTGSSAAPALGIRAWPRAGGTHRCEEWSLRPPGRDAWWVAGPHVLTNAAPILPLPLAVPCPCPRLARLAVTPLPSREEVRRGQATDGKTGGGERGLCLMAAWAGGGRPIHKSLGVSQAAALRTGLGSVLGCDAVSRRQWLGDSLSSQRWHLHLEVVSGAPLK